MTFIVEKNFQSCYDKQLTLKHKNQCSKMDKLEYRSVIRFLVLEGVTPTEIHARMLKAYGDLTPSSSTVKKWASEFKRGRTSIKDDPREGRPRCATGADVVENVFQQVVKDRRLKVREIADAASISTGSAFEILTKQLNLRKLHGRWVPTILTEEQKAIRIRDAETCLSIFNSNNNFGRRCITVGETWIHIYTPQMKKEQIVPPHKIKKVSTSSEKVLALIFWDSRGVLLIDYVERERDINGEYYANLLEQLNDTLHEKRADTINDGIFLYQDIAPTDRIDLVVEKLKEFNYTVLHQPPLSPDLSPSDYHLFPKLENFLQAKRFTTVEEAIAAVDKYLDDLPVSNFQDGILSLGQHWSDCISSNGTYIELNSNSIAASENLELSPETDNDKI